MEDCTSSLRWTSGLRKVQHVFIHRRRFDKVVAKFDEHARSVAHRATEALILSL